MKYVTFEKINDGKTLRITLEFAGHDLIAATKEDQSKNINSDEFFNELVEHQTCNGWTLLDPSVVGALSSSTILSDDVIYDENGDPTDAKSMYTDIAFYQVKSAVEKMLEDGYVDFARA